MNYNILPRYVTNDTKSLQEYSKATVETEQYDPDSIACRILGKYVLHVHAHDESLTPNLVRDGYWESWITLCMIRSLGVGMHCIDVGANMGYYSVLMADAVGDSGRVVAVEPQWRLVNLLERTIQSNGFTSRCSISQSAVSDVSGETVDLHIPPGIIGSASIVPYGVGYEHATTQKTVTTTIDQITHSWPRLDFVKMDAEGAESKIWKGMEWSLKRFPDVTIFLEFQCERYGESEVFLEQIVSDGFPLREIDFSGNVVAASKEELLQKKEWTMLYLKRT